MAIAKKQVKKRVTQKTQKKQRTHRILTENMTARVFRGFLDRQHACWQAKEWLGERDLKTAWAECPHGVWLGWLVIVLRREGKLKVSEETLDGLKKKHGSLVFNFGGSDKVRLRDLRSRFGVR